MKTKSKSASKQEPENAWIISREQVRKSNPVLYKSLVVDEDTVLHDESCDCLTALSADELKIIKQRFGEDCTLWDIQTELESNGISFEGKGWPFIVNYAKRKLKDNTNTQADIQDKASNEIVLTDGELDVLKCLVDKDALMSKDEIAAVVDLGDGTIKEALQYLERTGCVHRPRGPRKGYAATEKGKLKVK